ncbi:hypothetical protein [Beggiatoa leptomitoformis]|uniref:Lipoprotein n=1 Tax=Beggiatoa leptomitoformis TaxID=288004 RepID=A0A2N9YFK7_9GAMM|nr:hypothetical protein [Beggiatoa leptomitoformis]ALG68387.1 hypothetical protein AL038_12575 [Beggiatoa leptomitoformis]AUI69288.1 hypothetical protein BLE401_11690 [Beggiatoa leptomitoformis]
MNTIRLLIISIMLGACATPNGEAPSVQHGFSSALTGIGILILSPFQIATGLLEGIASVPYYLATGTRQINEGLVQAQAKITLDDTYESAYGKQLTDVPDNGDTGMVFRRMKHATTFFQKILRQYGVEHSENYYLTSIDTANDAGYTLLAVIYRPYQKIQVIDKYKTDSIRSFTAEDRLFYEPFQVDANKNPLDTVIDWAALPNDSLQTQKAQAVLLTLAANAVVINKRSAEYWQIEKRWLNGEYQVITTQRAQHVQGRMGL